MIKFTEGEVRAIKTVFEYAAARCGGGEDIGGAVLYTGAFHHLPADDGQAIVDLVNKIRGDGQPRLEGAGQRRLWEGDG